jgi:HK97 family phage portal protein
VKMGLLQRLFGSAPEQRARPSSWDLMRGIGFETESGVAVSPVLAENLAAVYAATQCIAESIASLPLYVYRRQGDGIRFQDDAHPVARLFRQPNDTQTGSELIEQLIAFTLLWGNAYAEIIRDARGAVIELYPLHPAYISIVRIAGTRRYRYDYSDPATGGTRRLLPEEVFHLRDRSDDGVCGKSRLQRARESIGTAIAVERFAASTFRNGARLAGVLSHPEALSDGALQNIKNSFMANFAGVHNANSTLVLEEV